MGLNGPVSVQFCIYLSRVLQGDLGRSMISNSAVATELGNTFGPTVELMLASLIWAVPLGILLGTLAAVRRGRLSDRVIMAISVAGVRSEEHTSELQSLMRISYAVFCLKKKKNIQ